MSQLFFRDATLDDLTAIVAIYNSTIESRLVTADTESVSVDSRLPWFAKHERGRRPLWVVQLQEQQEVAGWVSFQDFYGRPAYAATSEISIYLHPSYRGKGLGKQVLDYSIQTCPALGIKNLLAYIFAHNEPSLKLFQQAGFEEWAYLPHIAELDGVERSLKILGRRVHPVVLL
jgi:L-amino acid N-acyltransferase YncA